MNNRSCPLNKPASSVRTPYMCQSASGQELAMAYVPWQQFRELYESDEALYWGTVFKELNKPFHQSTGGRL